MQIANHVNNSIRRDAILHFMGAVLIIFSFFYGIASYPLLNNNDGLYAEIAREMMVLHNYVIPHLNFVPYIDKPPLLYWLLVASYHLFGVNTFAARFVVTSCAALTCISVYIFGGIIESKKIGCLGAVILASSIGYILIGRMVFFDILLTLCISLSLLFFYVWFHKSNIWHLRLSYIFLALAVLTKGFLAIAIILPLAVLYLWLMKSRPVKWRQFVDFFGIMLFIGIAFPWHVATAFKDPEFTYRYLVDEQILRFLNARYPYDYHTGPFYYYLPRIVLYMLPWGLLLPVMLLRLKKHFLQRRPFEVFLWLWVFIPLVFFSISGAKANYYMIISTPALAFLLGLEFKQYFDQQRSTVLSILFLSFTFLVGLAAFVTHFVNLKSAEGRLLHDLFLPMGIVFLLYGLAGGLLIYRKRVNRFMTSLLLIAGTVFPTLFFAVAGAQKIQDYISEASLAQYIIRQGDKRPIYYFYDFEDISTTLFYTRQRAYIVNSRSRDLYFAQSTSAAKGWFITFKQFEKQVKNKPSYVVIKKCHFGQFYRWQHAKDFREVKISGDVSLLSNFNSVSRSRK